MFTDCKMVNFEQSTFYCNFTEKQHLSFMTKVVLEIPNPQDLQLLLAFAKRLQATVLQISTSEDKSSVYWLEQLAAINSFEDIEDPVAWQREQRKERVLPFRD